MKVTAAFIKRMAKMPVKDQEQILADNPGTNFTGMATKCNDVSEQMMNEKKFILAEQIDNLKFLVSLHVLKMKKPDAVKISTGDGQFL